MVHKTSKKEVNAVEVEHISYSMVLRLLEEDEICYERLYLLVSLHVHPSVLENVWFLCDTNNAMMNFKEKGKMIFLFMSVFLLTKIIRYFIYNTSVCAVERLETIFNFIFKVNIYPKIY